MSTLASSLSPLASSSHSYDDALDTFALSTANTISSSNGAQFNTAATTKPSSSSSTSATSSSSTSPSSVSADNAACAALSSKTNTQQQRQEKSKSSDQMNSSLMCYLCGNKLTAPKLLSCLHSFCRQCLNVRATNECGDMNVFAINCPKCKQETSVPNGIDSLEDDYVMQNILDMIAIEEMILDCTSCKTDEKAMARCADCASFLCSNCVSAHQYMRCFENHCVVKFQDIIRKFKKMNESSMPLMNETSLLRTKERRASYCTSSSSSSSTCSNSSNEYLNDAAPATMQLPEVIITTGLPIHKPLFCKVHPKENLKLFCHTCQVPMCSDCVISTHQMHHHDRLSDVELKMTAELELLICKLKDKISECKSEYQLIDQYLSDLDEQREESKSIIEETFHSYKQLLEKKKDDLLRELKEKHTSKRQTILEINDNIRISIEQFNEVIRFIERVLRNGNGSEVSLLRSLIVNQFNYLVNNIPLTESIDVNLKFQPDEKRFEKAIHDTFGRFLTQKEIRTNYFNTLTSSSSQNENLMLAGKLNNEQTRLQQIQKQLEQQQQHNLIKPTFAEQEWLLNMVNNGYNKLNGYTHFEPPNDLQQSPTDDWLKPQQQKNMRTSLSPESNSSTSSSAWFKSNNYLNLPKQQPVRPTTPLGIDTNIMRNNNSNANNTIQQHQLFLQQQQQQQLSNSRCQTPAAQQQQHLMFNHQTKHSQLQNDLVAVTNALNISTNLQQIQNICLPNNANHLVVNGLDEYMPFSNSTSMAQNFNQLSKLITNQQHLTHGPAGDMLNMNLVSEINLANLHQNVVKQPVTSVDAISNPSQSPTALAPIGTGGSTVNQFSGNGNLNPPVRQTGKMKNMTIRYKFGQLGAGKSQFNSPHGFSLGVDEEIIVADTNNHRIQVFDKSGDFKYCFGSPGREEGQLWYPRKVIVMRDTGKIVVCDRGSERSRMQIFNRNGNFIKKIAIRYIDIVAGLAITQQGEIVAVDSVSPTVFRISEAGELIKWFDCSDYMREPSDIAINGNEYYVCDFKGHCVAVFSDEGNFIRRIGGENITNFPNGIEVSDEGDVLVGDSHGNRFHVAVFSRSGDLLSEFECPYVKVSRCCGLKITSEGHVVTLAKNNHHVLVLNTLYVQ